VALTIRLSAKEAEQVKAGVCPDSLRGKVEAAELRQKTRAVGKGLAPQVAIEAFREVLGKRLVPPLQGEYGQLGVLLRNKGLTRMQCVSAAKTAAAEWRNGPIRALSIVRQADVLLSAAQKDFPWGGKEPPGGWQGAVGIDE
jgi:hypothetical protein